MPTKTVNGHAISYEEAGQGTPLVLLHGFPLDSRIWAKQREALASKFRVITPDLRGFGKSASGAKFTLEDLADDVHALLHDVATPPFAHTAEYVLEGFDHEVECQSLLSARSDEDFIADTPIFA